MTRRVRPLRASYRGLRARPASTTTRTPSTVRLVSAMSVASTTRRRPGALGCNAASCSAAVRAPKRGRTSTAGPTRPVRACWARRISPAPGRNTRTSPDSSRRARRTASGTASTGRARLAGGSGTHRTSTSCWRPSLVTTAAWGPSRSATLAAARVADMTTRRRSGRSDRRTSSANARPRSAWRFRSWSSSKSTAATPGRSGSCCSRRVRMPSVTTSTRIAALVRWSSRVR